MFEGGEEGRKEGRKEVDNEPPQRLQQKGTGRPRRMRGRGERGNHRGKRGRGGAPFGIAKEGEGGVNHGRVNGLLPSCPFLSFLSLPVPSRPSCSFLSLPVPSCSFLSLPVPSCPSCPFPSLPVPSLPFCPSFLRRLYFLSSFPFNSTLPSYPRLFLPLPFRPTYWAGCPRSRRRRLWKAPPATSGY